jgi:NAD(P)-dependent dehydrogenase (short-subunit alcohol dehydrogenase family)
MTARYLVTGAGSGIGRELALLLQERGDQLVLPVRSTERGEELAPVFPGADLVVADLADPASVPDVVAAAGERLDGAVHAAGVVTLGPVAELDEDAWRSQLDVNLVAPALLTRGLLPALRAAGGTVVMVNSGAGQTAHPGWAAYAASKHGLKALADSLRGEEAAHGVRVSTVYPGRVATTMQEKVHAHEGKEYDPDDWIRPETVARAILGVLDLPADATVPDLSLRPR